MSLNPKVVGNIYEARPFEVTRAASLFFALSVGEDNNAYFDDQRPGGIIAPPMFAAVYSHGPVDALLQDENVGICRDQMLHYAQTFHWFCPVRPGDVISSRAEIKKIRFQENGGVLEFEVVSINQHGCVAVKADWAFFDRSAGSPGSGRPAEPAPKAGPPVFEARVDVPEGQTFLYAESSGDRNPIHIDEAHARAAGLPGIIVHGFCTMSLCHRVVTTALCATDPLRVKTLSMRFSRPVFPGRSLLFKGIRQEGIRQGDTESGQSFGITAEDEPGRAILKDAFCVIK